MKGNPDPPLTGPEIYLGEPVKLEVAELILREGTLYLQDMLAAKIQYEQKAAVLLAAYITLAVGLAGAALLTRDSLHGLPLARCLCAAARSDFRPSAACGRCGTENTAHPASTLAIGLPHSGYAVPALTLRLPKQPP